MRAALAAAAGLVLAWPAAPSAHRLDEYLQAARVSLEGTHVALEIDLTPGAAIAGEIVTLIDRDGNTAISPDEARAYGAAVLDDIVLHLDDRRVVLALVHAEAPSAAEMREGMGTIQLRARGEVVPAGAWRRARQLQIRNNHRPEQSVYLVNALVPRAENIFVVRQTRDVRQRQASIDYRVTPRWVTYLYWPTFGFIAGSWWLLRARRRGAALKASATPAAL